MNYRWLSALCLVVLTTCSHAQTVLGQFRYGTSGNLDVIQTLSCKDTAGNVYGSAQDGKAFAPAIITQKFNSNGVWQWTETFQSSDPNAYYLLNNMISSSTGEVTLVGLQISFASGSRQKFMHHINAGGKGVWTVHFPQEFNAGVCLDTLGNVITDSFSGNAHQIQKFSAATGAVIWTQPLAIPNLFVSSLACDAGSHLYAVVSLPGAQHAISLNPATGAIHWNVNIPPSNGGSYTFQDAIVLNGGDLVVRGNSSATLENLDRLSAATGAFVYRSTRHGVNPANTLSFLGNLAVDAANNVYWAATEVNPTTQKAVAVAVAETDSAGKVGALKGSLPTTAQGAELIPAVGGGLYVCHSDFTNPPNVLRLDSAGKQLWSTILSAAHSLFIEGDLSVDASNALGFVSGTVDTFGQSKILFTKFLASTGAIKFSASRAEIGIGSSELNVVGQDAAGNVYVDGSESGKVFVEELGPTGVVLWKTYLNFGVPGQFLHRGSAFSNTKGIGVAVTVNNKISVAKLTLAGTVSWAKQPPIPYDGAEVSLKFDAAGNLCLGTVSQLGATLAVTVIQLDAATGKTNWQRAVSSSRGGDLAIDASGNVYQVAASPNGAPTGFLLSKYSSTGIPLYTTLESTAASEGYSEVRIRLDSGTGDVYLAGTTRFGTTAKLAEVQIARYTAAGTKVWLGAKIFDGQTGVPSGLSLQLSPLGSQVLTLCTTTSKPSLEELDSFSNETGTFLWQHANPLGGSSSLDFDHRGNPIVAGFQRVPFQNKLCYVQLIDRRTGATRYTLESFGVFNTPFNVIRGFVVQSGDDLMVVGSTPSAKGTSQSNAWMVRLGQRPFSDPDAFTVAKGTLLERSVATNDEYVFNATYAVVANPAHASIFTLNPDGTFSYQSNASFTGTDTFTYRATNSNGVGNIATVTITVTN